MQHFINRDSSNWLLSALEPVNQGVIKRTDRRRQNRTHYVSISLPLKKTCFIVHYHQIFIIYSIWEGEKNAT